MKQSQRKNEEKKVIPEVIEALEVKLFAHPWETVVSKKEAKEKHSLYVQVAQSHVTPPGATSSAFSGDSTYSLTFSCKIQIAVLDARGLSKVLEKQDLTWGFFKRRIGEAG